MSARSLCCLLLLGPSPALANGQTPRAQPLVAVHTGFGNHYGWIGAAGEAYLVGGRLSTFAGIGIMPRELFDFPTSLAGVVGLRYYARSALRRIVYSRISLCRC